MNYKNNENKFFISDNKTFYNDLSKRFLNFASDVIKFLRLLDNDIEFKIIKNQLIKSVSSAGANYEEAQAASSKADFLNKIRISLKEMRESNYWFKLISLISNDRKTEIEILLKESDELKRILGSIASKVSNNLKT